MTVRCWSPFFKSTIKRNYYAPQTRQIVKCSSHRIFEKQPLYRKKDKLQARKQLQQRPFHFLRFSNFSHAKFMVISNLLPHGMGTTAI